MASNFVFIVTNDESHWQGISEVLKEKEISFYPKTEDDFCDLRDLCEIILDSSGRKYKEKAESEIKKIIFFRCPTPENGKSVV